MKLSADAIGLPTASEPAEVSTLRSGCPVCRAHTMFLFRVSENVSMPAVSRDTASTYLPRPSLNQSAPRSRYPSTAGGSESRGASRSTTRVL